jgi:outer membrane protein
MSIFAKKRNFNTSTLTVFILAMVLSLAVIQPEKAYAAETVGEVDYLYLINNHPDTPKANEELRAEQEQAKKDYDIKAATVSDKEKQDLALQLAQRMEQKRQELIKPIAEKINAAIKAVADSKGLTVILSKASVVYGGVDITNEVFKKITGK